MKKIYLVMALSILFSSGALANGKVDPLLNIMSRGTSSSTGIMKAMGAKSVDSKIMTGVLIKVADGKLSDAKSFIGSLGGKVGTTIGDIMVVEIPVGAISQLGDSPLIARIEANKPVRGKMDEARDASSVTQVQNLGYGGSGVISGVVDSGIDCTHPDFEDASGDSRILDYCDQNTTIVYSGSDSSCADAQDESGHGTHVAGIAAGSNSTYTGVAPQSDIVFVKYGPISDGDSGGTFSTYILDGVSYIFAAADYYDKPAVINLSVGTSLGAHDGTSLLEQGLDNAILSGGAEKAGRVIVNAAGNENVSTQESYASTMGGIHADISVSSGTPRGYEIAVLDSAEALGSGGVIADVWLSSGSSSCTLQVDGYKSGVKVIEMPAVPFNSEGSADDGEVQIDLSFGETAESGKLHGAALITNVAGENPDLSDYYFVLIATGSCSGDAWLYPDQTDITDFTKEEQITTSIGYTYTAGNSDETITIPGTADSVITVASYMDYSAWVGLDGATHQQTGTSCGGTGGTVDDMSLFSSVGPTANGATKPDVTAPGERIISTLPYNLSPLACMTATDEIHYKMQGTSMASPHVAGTVALLLEKNNCLTASQIKLNLRTYADADAYTGAVPNDNWGYGKLNAYNSFSAVSVDTSCYSGSQTGSAPSTTYCNPGASSSGGCGGNLSDSKMTKGFLFSLLGIVLVLGGVLLARRRYC